MPDASNPSFLELLELHRELDEVFTLHQELLLLLRIERAARMLGVYRDLLHTHMQHEEQTLLEIFARAGEVPRWPAVLYTGQHEKMRGMLDRLEQTLRALERGGSKNLRRDVLAVLELETAYKHLAEHHDGAEREGLFPISDGVSSAEERRQLIGRFRSEFQAVWRGHAALIDAVRHELL